MSVTIEPSGTDGYQREEDFRASNGLAEGPHRSIEEEYYPWLEAAGVMSAYQEAGITAAAPQHLLRELQGSGYSYIYDRYAFEKARTHALSSFDPSDMSLRSDAARYEMGIYVPSGYVLPLGDNRDNSHDGRYFGPVMESKVNGRVIGRFWPIGSISSLMDNQ